MTATTTATTVVPGEVLTREHLTQMLPTAEAGVIDGLVGILEQYSEHPITLTPDEAGGVYVVIDGIDPGAHYVEAATWFGFQISAAYPFADVYPHYVGRIGRGDLAAHGEAIAMCEWQGREALQLSRRSNRWNPATDSAVLKSVKVLSWLASR